MMSTGSLPTLIAQQELAPKIEWSSSVDIDVEDWAYQVIETSNGDYVSVGFSKVVYEQSSDTPKERIRIPSFAILDNNGRVKKFETWDNGEVLKKGGTTLNGDFKDIEQDEEGNIYIIGFKRTEVSEGDIRYGIPFIKLNSNYEIIESKFVNLPNILFEARAEGMDIYENPNNPSQSRLAIVGGAKLNAGDEREQFLLTLTLDGNVTNYKHIPENNFGKSSLKDCAIIDNGNGDFDVVYTGSLRVGDNKFTVSSTDMNSEGIIDPNGTTQMPRFDNDIIVGRVNKNLVPYSGYPKLYTSFDASGASSTVLPTVDAAISQSYGPATPGRTPSSDPCYSPALDQYYTNNSDDRGNSIIVSEDEDYFYVSSLTNVLFIKTGAFFSNGLISNALIQNTTSSANHLYVSCDVHSYHHYYDSDIYLMKFDISSNQLISSKHVGHNSGGDFDAPIIEDDDGNIVIGGTSADRNFHDGLPDVFPDAPFANTLTKVDAGSMAQIWRRHFVGTGIGNCLFGLTKTSDGGYLVCGNAENADVNVSEEVENYNFVKLSASCQLAEIYDPNYEEAINYLPSSSTIWNTDKKIKGQVVVQSGENLRINNGAFIEFADGREVSDYDERVPTGIKVESGGVLIVEDGATLTRLNSCTGKEMWDGIIGENGSLIQVQDAKVEYAIYGIFLGGRSYDVIELNSNTTTPQGNTANVNVKNIKYVIDKTKAGGVAFGANAEFANNFIGVRYLEFDGSSNLGNFTSCNFYQNDGVPDNFYNTTLRQRTLGLKTFVDIRGIKYNPYFDGCTFDGWEELPVKERGYGILSINSKIQVTASPFVDSPNFMDLRVGISSRSTTGSANENIYVSGNKFYNVLNGINIRGTFGDWVDDNVFEVPFVDGEKSWGIFTSSASGFKISNNEFTNIPTGDFFKKPHYGTIINNSAAQGGLTWRNTYEGFFYGKQFERNNSDIDNFCNEYTGGFADWVVGAYTTPVDDMKDQGLQDGRKADNQFFDNCGSSTADIYSNIPFNYFDKLGNPNPIADGDLTGSSICVTGANYEVDNENSPIECLDEDDPCSEAPCLIKDHEDKYDGSSGEKGERNELIRTYQHTENIEVTTPPDFSKSVATIQFLTDRQQTEDKRLLVATLKGQEDNTGANNWLSELEGTDVESVEFNEYYTTLIDAEIAGRDIYNLTATEYNTITSFLKSETLISERAKTIDFLVNGVDHPLVPQELKMGKEGEQRSEEIVSEKINKTNSLLTVSPNPFNEEVNFDLKNVGENVEVEIIVTDISGKIIWKTHRKNANQIRWKPKLIKSGLYFYLAKTDTGDSFEGKLIFINN